MKLLSNFHVRDLLKGTAQALIIKIIATAAGFIVSISLGRIYGPEGVGIYALMLTTIMVSTTLSTAGLESAVIRFASADIAMDKYSNAMKVIKTALILVLILSTCIAFIMLIGRDIIANSIYSNSAVSALIKIIFAAIICISLTRICAAALKAIGNIPAAQFSDGVALPCGILVVLYFTNGNTLDRAAFAYLFGALLAISLGLITLMSSIRREEFVNAKLSSRTIRRIMSMGMPTLGIIIGVAITELVVTITLSHFSTMDVVGNFRIAWQVAFLISFYPMATDNKMSPKISTLHSTKDFSALAKILRVNIILLASFCIPTAIVLIYFSSFIFSLFGTGFQDAAPILSYLVIGHIINGTLGTAGKVLIMTGHEKKSLINSSFSAIIIIISSLVLIPLYGGEGAAAAVVLTMVIRCVVAVTLVRIYLGINMITGKYYY